jgi:uncharacterized membrane protein YfcA
MAVGTTIGALAGGRVLNKLSYQTLQILFFVIIIFLIGQMIYKGIISL